MPRIPYAAKLGVGTFVLNVPVRTDRGSADSGESVREHSGSATGSGKNAPAEGKRSSGDDRPPIHREK